MIEPTVSTLLEAPFLLLIINLSHIQAGFSDSNIRPTPGPSRNPKGIHVQEAIQRELEKEQIRQEIIAAETARRRELVVEVMREMAVEREMAMRSSTEMEMSFEEKLTMWIDYRFSSLPAYENHWLNQHLAFSDPLQCTSPYNMSSSPVAQNPPCPPLPEPSVAVANPTVGPGKGKLIILDRPDPNNICGTKRKAVTTPAVGAGELHLLGSKKKKPKEEWSCALCQVSATCERGLNEHLQGKKHKAKEAALRAENMAKKAVSLKNKKKVSLKLTESEQVVETKEAEIKTACKKNIKIKFWCEICNVGTFTKAVMKKHKLGRKHNSRLEEQSDHPEAAPAMKPTSTATEASAIQRQLSDATAEAKVEGAESEEGKVGDMVVDKVKLEDQKPEEVRSKEVETNPKCKRNNKFKFWCEICNVGTFSKAVMETHKLGRKHKARLQEQSCSAAVVTTKPTSETSLSTTTATATAAITMLSSDATRAEVLKEAKVKDQTAGEAKGEDPMVKEMKGEDSVAEEVKDPMAQEASLEDPEVEEARVGDHVMEEISIEDPRAKDVRLEDPMAEEVMVEDSIMDEVKEEDPTVKEVGVEDSKADEVREVDPKVKDPMAREAKGDDSAVEGEDPMAREAKGEDPAVDEANMKEAIAEEESVEDPSVEKAKEDNPTVEGAKGEDPAVEEKKEVTR